VVTIHSTNISSELDKMLPIPARATRPAAMQAAMATLGALEAAFLPLFSAFDSHVVAASITFFIFFSCGFNEAKSSSNVSA
jgi:hypothetical protein